MFSLAYVLLPFSDVPPADAITASLARFQRGGPGDLPDDWIGFHDETGFVRTAHEARWAFTVKPKQGMTVEGGNQAIHCLDTTAIRNEMARSGLQRWPVRFADDLTLDEFFDRFVRDLLRHPTTGRFGHWLNPLGRWDWWDLGGRFDGVIIGDRKRNGARATATISSGDNPGRRVLANIETVLGSALGLPRLDEIDVLTNRNIELVATLLTDLRDGQPHACPGALVLPPGAVEDPQRWLRNWPELGPAEAFAWLGLPPDTTWETVAEAVYLRFSDHWVAGVAYHL